MSDVRSYFHQVIAGRPSGMGQQLLSMLLKAASLVYGVAVRLARMGHRIGFLPSNALACPVISVGNLTWGGTGKTPFTSSLTEHLMKEGKKVAILTRGYGQDEVDLLRRQLPQVPVYVGRDRVATGRRAIQEGAQILILDDGFQHWRLRRDLDIVLLNAESPFGNGWLLPGGTLREEPRSLERAGVVVLSKAKAIDKNLEAQVRRLSPNALILTANYRPVDLEIWASGERQPLSQMQNKRIGIFSGIADPVSFEKSLEMLGAVPVLKKRFLDHHPFTKSEIDPLAQAGVQQGATVLVTTLKDAVRIPKEWAQQLPLPLWVLHAQLEISHEEALIERLHSVLVR